MQFSGYVRHSVQAILAVLIALSMKAEPAYGASGSEAVLQLLTDQCVKCHNAKQSAGGLRLDSLEVLSRGGSSGAAVLPGNSAGSILYSRITATSGALRMPPAGASLPPERISLIKEWIDSGAEGLIVASGSPPERIDFGRDIEPILKASCYDCHSGSRPKSGLRLDARTAALNGGTGGIVIKPGDGKSSRLVHRIEGRDGEPQMPLGRPPLTAGQIATVRQWIDSGAEWPVGRGQSTDAIVEKHWAYRPPVSPTVPEVTGPVKNPIDNFLLARLTKEGMKFSPPASKEKLLRRVSLDLTGLPPTMEEIDSFLQDSRPDAYERVVDRLLASPAYGERWARPWLDYARYADTNGYEADFRRTMWKFRDWVIDALNKDMPFDRFTI
jgi:hypothetical protein